MTLPRIRAVLAFLLACVVTSAGGLEAAQAAPTGTVTITSTGLSGIVGRPMTATGTTTVPSPTRAVTEVWLSDHWSSSQSSAVSGGSFTVNLTYGASTAGTYTYRVRVDSDAGSVYSDSFTVTRLSTAPQIVSAPTSVLTNTPGSVTVQIPNGGAGTRVSTQFKRGTTWSTSQTVTTGSTGRATLSLTYGWTSPGTYTWRVVSTNAYGVSSVSAARTLVRSSAAPVITSAPTSVTTNTTGTVTAKVAGVGAGHRVWVQFWVGSGWSNSVSGSTNSAGQVTLPLTYAKTSPGTYSWRVVTSRGGYNYASEYRRLTRLSAHPIIVRATPNAQVNASASVTVRLYGVGSGHRVWTQFWVNGKWQNSQFRTTNSSGVAVIPLSYGAGSPGNYGYRVMTQRGSYYYGSQIMRIIRTRVYLDSRCTTGRAICVDKTARKVYWVVNGNVYKTLDARFAAPGYSTPTGSYKVYRKVYLDYSRSYNNAKMPFSIYYQGGRAVHYSYGFAAQGWNGGSHGCVNLRDWAGAAWLYNQARVGDKVIIFTH